MESAGRLSEVKIITCLCQKILRTIKDEGSVLPLMAAMTDLPIGVMLRSNSCDYLAQ